MKNVIEFVELRSHKEWFLLDAYEFAPKGKSAWLQRWAWKFLHWCKALNQMRDSNTTYTKHLIHTSDVIETLFKQRQSLFAHVRRDGQSLLIGSEDFAALMRQPEIHQYLSFNAAVHRDHQILGLKVQIIPWMRGMVVMP